MAGSDPKIVEPFAVFVVNFSPAFAAAIIFMKLALDKISRLIPDWNQRQLTEDDFFDICAHFGVTVDELPLRVDGFYYEAAGRPFIAFNSLLPQTRKLFVMFHELGHFLLHSPQGEPAVNWHSIGRSGKKEKEADAFALCAIWPKSMVTDATEPDLVRDDESAAEMYSRRLRLLWRYGF